MNPIQQILISHDSSLLYLPLMFFLPEDTIAKYPTLLSLPRCLGEIARSEKLIDLIGSDAFLKEIMDATAALAFPHFGFGGWIEHYTGYFPVWKLSYALPIWAKLLEAETGWGLQSLFNLKSTKTVPFFNREYIKGIMERLVKRAIAEEGWQPLLDVVKEMPCDEDFEEWNTNVRIDFQRKWYHTRSKRVKTVSLEECLEDEGHGIHEIAADSLDIAETVAADDFCRRFKSRLSDRDMKILELRVEGFTYEEIAYKLGYKNHSGVIKRMQAIKKKFLDYEQKAKH